MALITVGYLYFRSLNKGKLKPTTFNRTQNSYLASLEKQIKTNFSAPEYKDIIDYTNLSLAEKDINKKYQDYVKVFGKVSLAYQRTKNPEFLAILMELRKYLIAYPDYKEGDVVIPK